MTALKTCKPDPAIAISSRGFTLLELMISIVLLSVIILIIFSAARLGFRSIETGGKKIEALERNRASLNIINAQVQSMTPLTYNDPKAKNPKPNYFKGEGGLMQFSTNYSIWGGQRGYVVVSYRIEPDNDGKQTLYATENTVGIEDYKETKLLEALDKLSFEYFYKGPTDEKGDWIEKWTDDTNIPLKIRINFIIGKSDISLIIPMWANRSAAQATAGLFGPY